MKEKYYMDFFDLTARYYRFEFDSPIDLIQRSELCLCFENQFIDY